MENYSRVIATWLGKACLDGKMGTLDVHTMFHYEITLDWLFESVSVLEYSGTD